MAKFLALAEYEKPMAAGGYRPLPYRFMPLSGDRYVLTNLVGEFVITERQSLRVFADGQLSYQDELYSELKSKHFLIDGDSDVALDLLAIKVRTKLSPLANFTGLHIFVVTLRCEHSCPYCQVSRANDDRREFDMTRETALRSLDLVFRSPSPAIKIEFQGGESLLNLDLVEFIIEEAKRRNEHEQRDLAFVLATNLAVLDDRVLALAARHQVLISTSLDGPADLHNKNRPRPGGDSHARAIAGIHRARMALGRDQVGALMTTTAASLSRVRDIIDEYITQDFDGIFLRPLSPYGFAVKTKSYAAYNETKWLDFYFEGLDYIIDLNLGGFPFVEHYAAMILQKMLTPFQPGYVDLMSPAGIGIGAVVYNYDGDVYASDEARMLAEMGDTRFRIGNVHANTYEEIFLGDALLDPLEQSFAASVPMCSWCAFEPWCGSDPVFHHATQGDFVGKKPLSAFCGRNMMIFKGLLQRLNDRPQVREVFERWANIR
ncbi:His-Xaa-Ser system radical SAM maturase HxsB [Sphingobium jiangsuense]|uniref:His-Xaa-Ser system radical SAM maturase HxsB n=1 Tax=Sphingobium jiangsuense TaxID=870476 RepID=A0A7W6BMV9_9SPHN|nr:His-Xaa-Ser system radical SAM maturase HxsB [Sphingobium jiangsuense]MBB3925538.1 His-Xaa-Ser system radical SAM maturase HxsB [Sphingobium jiangsuense]